MPPTSDEILFQGLRDAQALLHDWSPRYNPFLGGYYRVSAEKALYWLRYWLRLAQDAKWPPSQHETQKQTEATQTSRKRKTVNLELFN